MTGSKSRRISKIRATRRMTWHRGNHMPLRRKNLAFPVTQFTGPDAPRCPHHAQAKSGNGVKGSARRCT
jgi:hypothetical protein